MGGAAPEVGRRTMSARLTAFTIALACLAYVALAVASFVRARRARSASAG